MDDAFTEHRSLLFAVAYRMTGSVADAEDIVQETWLRWAGADRSEVAAPKAFLVRTATNLALNQLTSARARRESYVGPWLPEPLLTGPDGAEEVEMAESVSMAMLVVLESLSPLERAVFLLHEVFGYPHAEIAGMLNRPEPAVRQAAHRAREHVHARRPRYSADQATARLVVDRFREACAGGDLAGVLALLAPEVTAWSDGGGVVQAARRPLRGPDHVARWLLGVLAKPASRGVVAEPVDVNGEPGVLFSLAGQAVGAATFQVTGGRISELRVVLNPAKLRGLAR